MEIETVLVVVVVVLWLIGAGIKALFRLLTGEARREREEQQRQQEEQRKRDEERKRKEAAERQARADAISQFDHAVMDGRFPSDEVLAVLSHCDGYLDTIPPHVKEAVDELLWDRFIPNDITYGGAVRLIRQQQRKDERARQRAARADQAADDASRPLTEADAFALLGVARGCTTEELANAYRRKMLQWHPDRLDIAT